MVIENTELAFWFCIALGLCVGFLITTIQFYYYRKRDFDLACG